MKTTFQVRLKKVTNSPHFSFSVLPTSTLFTDISGVWPPSLHPHSRRSPLPDGGDQPETTIMTNGTVKDSFISINMEEENENIFTSYPVEAGRHVSFLTGFEDEVMGAEHSFLEHECDKDLVGSHLDFATFNLRKCFSVENLSCPLEYDEMIDGDVVDSTHNIGDETKTEFFDGMLQETDDLLADQKTLPLTPKLSSNDKGPHNGYPNEENNPCDDDGEKVGSENNSRVEYGDARLESGNRNSSTVFDLMSVKELQDTFKSMFGRETIVVDKQWLKRRIMFGMQNNELNKDLNFMKCDMSSREMDDKIGSTESSAEMLNRFNSRTSDIECKPSLMLSSTGTLEICKSFQGKVDEAGACITGKRAHRPPKRFIEESSELKLLSSKRRRCAVSSSNNNRNKTSKSKVKLLRAKHEKQLCFKEPEESQSLCQEEPFDGACIQVPFGLPVEEEQQLKEKTCLKTTAIVPFIPCLDSDNSPSNQSTISNERSDPDCSSIKLIEEEEEEEYAPTDDYEYDVELSPGIQKSSGGSTKRRRKHHIPWTQSEVAKLIDGVAHLGVGRWSKIKRLLFSSSKHRTSVDLKDKWRNLVKASSQLKKKRKQQGCLVQVRKPLSHQAPEPVLRRVKELATHYSLMD